jgi:hypothetical protein
MALLNETILASTQSGVKEKRIALDRDGREVSIGNLVRDIHGTEYVVKDVFDSYEETKTPSQYARRLFVVDAAGGRRYSPAKDFSLIDMKTDNI